VYYTVYTYNNIVIYYLVLERINDTIENERTSSFSRVEGVVVVGCSRELPTTLENKLLMLVFEDGSGGGAKEQPPSKTSICGLFSRMVWWW